MAKNRQKTSKIPSMTTFSRIIRIAEEPLNVGIYSIPDNYDVW